jgi:hypothetical protein
MERKYLETICLKIILKPSFVALSLEPRLTTIVIERKASKAKAVNGFEYWLRK